MYRMKQQLKKKVFLLAEIQVMLYQLPRLRKCVIKIVTLKGGHLM